VRAVIADFAIARYAELGVGVKGVAVGSTDVVVVVGVVEEDDTDEDAWSVVDDDEEYLAAVDEIDEVETTTGPEELTDAAAVLAD
jgi:hypothetical protein